MQVSELDMMSLSGLLEFLAYETCKPDPEVRKSAFSVLGGLIANMHANPIDPADALAVQAFAIALLKEAPMFAGSREEMLNSIAIITALVQAVGVALERMTGKQLSDYAFFENPPKVTQQ
ncbi:hypothetical protein D3C87_1768420 [compost metagenome]